MKTKSNSPKCQCGCEATTKGGRFLPGHDARLKSALIKEALEGSKRAATKLNKLGWKKFLDAKQAKQASAPAKEEAAGDGISGRN